MAEWFRALDLKSGILNSLFAIFSISLLIYSVPKQHNSPKCI